jgi:cullin-associated NEDD8-dissociated protein 1
MDTRLLLFNNGESDEEGTRNIVAECLGRLTLLNPTQYLAELQVCMQPRVAAPRPEASYEHSPKSCWVA